MLKTEDSAATVSTTSASGASASANTAAETTVSGDGASGDGASGDGATGDGATGDGASGDGVSGDGATGDGVSGDGVSGDGATGDGATGDGASGDGATGDGASGDGASGATVSADGAPSKWRGCADGGRIVVKAGTALLTGGGDHIDIELMAALVGQISQLHARDYEMLLVSSGAVAAGRRVLGVSGERNNLPLKQALAAVGQGHLMHTYEQLFSWQRIPIAQGLISQRDISDRLGYINIRNALMELARRKVVPIINENDVVAIEELSGEVFGDNDRLSALVSNLVDADLLIILGRVDGLYTADPNIDADARFIPQVERLTEKEVSMLGGPSMDALGRGGMRTKLQAARMAANSGVDVFIANGSMPKVIERIAGGEHLGTFFPANRGRMESRKRWMLSGLSVKGAIGVDDGAARVLQRRNGSLLPAGITTADGAFRRGDLVSIVNRDRAQIGRGITNYSAVEVARIKGKHSRHIADILGVTYGDEVVHRNNMVIV